MGLALVNEIVKATGGSIAWKSAPGEGTTFCISIPIQHRGKPISEEALEMLDIFGLLVGKRLSLLLCLHGIRPRTRQGYWIRHIRQHDTVDLTKIEVMIFKLFKEVPG